MTQNSVHLKTENIFKFVVRVAKQSFSFVWFSGRLKRSWEIFTSIPLISSSWLRMANNPKKCRSREKTHFLSTFPLHTALQVAGFYEIAFKWLLTTTQSTTQQVKRKNRLSALIQLSFIAYCSASRSLSALHTVNIAPLKLEILHVVHLNLCNFWIAFWWFFIRWLNIEHWWPVSMMAFYGMIIKCHCLIS